MATAKCKIVGLEATTESPLVIVKLYTTRADLAGFHFYGMDEVELVQKEKEDET